MRLGTFCSGIGAPEVAGMGEPIWAADIEPFPNAVRAHHWPDLPNLGDITAPDIIDRITEIGLPDIVVAGLPCQPFSVAGLRRGEEDHRNLTVRFVEIADAIDDLRRARGEPPVWWLVENVPGLLSDKANAFGALLGGLVGHDTALDASERRGWTNAGVVDGPSRCAAWRVLDAQYFGVAQRRRRVFVLARGGAGAWAVADALLPVIDSMSRHPAPRREAGEETAGTLASRTGAGGFPGTDEACEGYVQPVDVAQCITTGTGRRYDAETETLVGHGMAVRRLTPQECEALQGFPRGYTRIPWRNKAASECPDGPRYRALGNSMAVPVMAWIGQRIAAVEQITAAGGYLDSLEESPDVGDYEHDRRHWAHALDAVRREVLEEVLRTIAAEREAFKDPAYAGGPNGSFNEIFACNEIERAIRAIMDKEPSR